ncbi:RNA-binding domain-containing protein [Halosegnis sp.]|uniref:RNA-binding domain-containing protein n=1 Tax=Halosegnis sp. TaxID=2864959 RepID=UPI0035D4FBAB
MSIVYAVDVAIRTPVHDTELPDRVARAVENLFPEADLTWGDGELRGEAHGLATFAEQLREQAILDVARETLLENREGATTTFRLKKAAAFEGVVNFAVGTVDELGEIEVELTVHDPSFEAYVDHVAPPTEDGEPLT